MDITHNTEPTSQHGTKAWTLHTPKMRFSPREQKSNGKLREVSDEKPWKERGIGGKQVEETGVEVSEHRQSTAELVGTCR